MGKKNDYLAKRNQEHRLLQEATRQTFVQYMTDTLILTLNDREVMGKDVFGYARLKKVLDAWGKYYDKFFDALTKKTEADYAREKMDEVMKRICGDTRDFSHSRKGISGCRKSDMGPILRMNKGVTA